MQPQGDKELEIKRAAAKEISNRMTFLSSLQISSSWSCGSCISEPLVLGIVTIEISFGDKRWNKKARDVRYGHSLAASHKEKKEKKIAAKK